MLSFIISLFLSLASFVDTIIKWLIAGASEHEIYKYTLLGKNSVTPTTLNIASSENPLVAQGFWDVISDIIIVLQPVGIALSVTFFIVNIIDLASKDNATFEHFLRQIVTVIITVTVISRTVEIINALITITDSIMLTVVKSMDNPITVSLDDGGPGLIERLVIIVVCLLPALIGLIADVALMFPLFSRMFEVGWRSAFFPIGVANFTGGANSPAVKYIKSLAAVMLTGAFYVVVLKVQSTLVTGLYTQLVSGIAGASFEGGAILLGAIFAGGAAGGILAGVGAILVLGLKAILLKFAALGVMMGGTKAVKEFLA